MKVTPVEVVKAFEISFYLDNQDATEDIHKLMNKKDGFKT